MPLESKSAISASNWKENLWNIFFRSKQFLIEQLCIDIQSKQLTQLKLNWTNQNTDKTWKVEKKHSKKVAEHGDYIIQAILKVIVRSSTHCRGVGKQHPMEESPLELEKRCVELVLISFHSPWFLSHSALSQTWWIVSHIAMRIAVLMPLNPTNSDKFFNKKEQTYIWLISIPTITQLQ